MTVTRNESAESAPRILFVDDDRDVQSAARLLFCRRGMEVLAAHDAEEALTQLVAHSVDLVLLDLNYTKGATTGSEGLALLTDMLVLRPGLPVIVVTGHSGVTIAVAAIRAGAVDFVMKPWNNERLLSVATTALQTCRACDREEGEAAMIVASADLKACLAEADRLAQTRAPLMISGPSGVGKTLLARRIHALSKRGEGVQMIRAEDCDTLPSESGTWIFRNIEALPPPMQRRLADRLDDYDPPRVIALTALERSAAEAALDPRLMLSLGVVVLTIPPLTTRPEDVVALTTHFLRYFAARHGLAEPLVDDAHWASLRAEEWPQNARSLRAVAERAVLTGAWRLQSGEKEDGPSGGLRTLRDHERAQIETALRKNGFNVTHAARDLGLTRPSLYRRMARYGL